MSSKSTRSQRSASLPSTNRPRAWTSKRILRPVAGIPIISAVWVPPDIEVCFDDVVSIKAYSVDENMFIGNGCVHLSPEHLEPLRSVRVSNRFQFMKAGVGGHGAINQSRVRREERLREVQEVPQELRLGVSASRIALTAGLSSIRCGAETAYMSVSFRFFDLALSAGTPNQISCTGVMPCFTRMLTDCGEEYHVCEVRGTGTRKASDWVPRSPRCLVLRDR